MQIDFHFTDVDGEARLHKWLEAFKNDYFGFGSSEPAYVGEGEGSWKHVALGDDCLFSQVCRAKCSYWSCGDGSPRCLCRASKKALYADTRWAITTGTRAERSDPPTPRQSADSTAQVEDGMRRSWEAAE